MRTRSFLPLIVHASACALLAGAFLFYGAPRAWMVIRARTFGPVLPHHTTDGYLRAHVSERLLQSLAALPRERPIAAIVRDGSDENFFAGYLLTYFAWPREVRRISVRRENATAELRALDQSLIAAIFFCGVEPPAAMQPAIHITADLVMVPTAMSLESKVP